MNLASAELSRIASDALPWLPYPLIKNSHFKVLKVHEDTNTVILRFKMAPHTVTPRHGHHCVATAYTLSGIWYYDDLEFRAGDVAFEFTTDVHQPITKEVGAELLTTFIGGRDNDRLIEEFPDNGAPYVLRTRFFKALEGITPGQMQQLDFAALIG